MVIFQKAIELKPGQQCPGFFIPIFEQNLNMALTPTTPLELGFPFPEFQLLEPKTGKQISASSVKGGNGMLVMFICNHCPFVIHVKETLVKVAAFCEANQIGVVAINSNDFVVYPADSPEEMVKTSTEWGFNFPYLLDETQEVAKAYNAACTPDFNLFNGEGKCVYRGRLDGSRPGNNEAKTGQEMLDAIAAIVAGKEILLTNPSMGCNIKWK
ncbi:MAG: thiol-disulfide isomerase/thioredoxin [Luteibaculaceae bacterium]